ncbi:MAG: 1-acyl-sn-glycerol-3-phosphate acyltransferase [Bacteroides sp.]|jgi:1-acyl-sn-glycerol-3-phosphate acyltransferase|nr:1-acyl-sn-glycerol-3-phosphate acyltransferase [Bacteroides sp.]
MSWLAGFILKIFGWKIEADDIRQIKKGVIVMAPHTSYWDFPIGRLALLERRISIKTMIKKEMFSFPLGLVLRFFGGIPVDRSNSQKIVKSITDQFKKEEDFLLLIAPEGTRKLNKRWKKGFYFIAQTAGVPIILGFLDYSKKVAGLGPVIFPSGDYEEDLKKIEQFYMDKVALHPEQFNLSAMYHKESKDKA